MGNQENVKTVYPDAICDPLHNQPGAPDDYEILTSASGTVIGSGKTAFAAWEDASNLLKAV